MLPRKLDSWDWHWLLPGSLLTWGFLVEVGGDCRRSALSLQIVSCDWGTPVLRQLTGSYAEMQENILN